MENCLLWKKHVFWRTSIGVQKLVKLFADNVYQTMFKKSLENEKWPPWQMIDYYDLED